MDKHIFQVLQFAGGTFPNGNFSHSWGIETYVSEGKIKTANQLHDFLLVYLKQVIEKNEAPFVSHTYRAMGEGDLNKVIELNQVATATKLTKESYEASVKMGSAMFRIAVEILDSDRLHALNLKMRDKKINQPIAFGSIMAAVDVGLHETVCAYAFTTINALIQCGLKLIPLGNTEAQKLLYLLADDIADSCSAALNIGIEDISNFNPALEISTILHEDLETRLYIS